MESALSETSHPLQEDLVLEFILLAEFNEVEGKLIIGVYPENAQKYSNADSDPCRPKICLTCTLTS